MVLSNPWYIDANARHLAPQQRLLAYSALEGQQGVLGNEHLKILASATPDDKINMQPGGYGIKANHSGGAYEAYVGKLSVAEQSVSISPVGSSGPRTDLVILRVENPYVSGDGNWSQPADPVDGPYVYLRVIENVPATTPDVSAYNSLWSAITLARITRPANTGVIQQSHIVDLRSVASLGGQRVTVINNNNTIVTPPGTPAPAPVIAQDYWTNSLAINQGDSHLGSQLAYHDFPAQATWNVPVPSWAVEFDYNLMMSPDIDGSLAGLFRLVMSADSITNDTGGAAPVIYDWNYTGGPGLQRMPVVIGGTLALQTGLRGRVVKMKLQAMSTVNNAQHPGKIIADTGTQANIWINFKRTPY